MPTLNKTLQVPFSAAQMYALINDIEAYPQFLPWCKSAIIRMRGETQLEATLCIGKGLVYQTISTINSMVPNQQITMQYQAGSFKHCHGSWDFKPVQTDTCEVVFNIDYAFNNKLAALTFEPIFTPITNKLIDAFYLRAHELYAR